MSDPLDQARLKVNDALARKRAADRACSDSNREQTNALNALNEAQKEFDIVVDKIRRESATLDSDWGQRRLK